MRFRLLLEIGSSNAVVIDVSVKDNLVSVSCWRLVLLTVVSEGYRTKDKRFPSPVGDWFF